MWRYYLIFHGLYFKTEVARYPPGWGRREHGIWLLGCWECKLTQQLWNVIKTSIKTRNRIAALVNFYHVYDRIFDINSLRGEGIAHVMDIRAFCGSRRVTSQLQGRRVRGVGQPEGPGHPPVPRAFPWCLTCFEKAHFLLFTTSQ